jgi:voltage-gated potassium channel
VSGDQYRDEQRDKLLHQVVELMEAPMVVLGFAWLLLLIIDFVWGLSRSLQIISTII